MYHTILVPLDGSKRAEAILPHIENLAKRYSARVILLQVINSLHHIGTYHPTDLIEETWLVDHIEQALDYFKNLAWDYQSQGIQVQELIEKGPIVGTIMQVAQRENVDLVALASHGRTGMDRVFYGSVAAGVLHSIDRPLLLIRSDS